VLEAALTMTPATTARGQDKKTGCGCQTGDAAGGLSLVALLALSRRRKR
jgi:MYXO-CTERM domain-containing protein